MTSADCKALSGWAIFGLLLVGLSCKGPDAKKKPAPQNKSDLSGAVKLAGLDGTPIDLAQYKGRTVFLNFWATWCKPCIQEMPSIKRAQDLLSKEGVVFLLASNEGVEQIEGFKRDHGADLSLVQVLNLEELRIEALPTTFIFNPKGERVFSEVGYRNWDDTTNVQLILKINNQK